jgi:hypothetical protein
MVVAGGLGNAGLNISPEFCAAAGLLLTRGKRARPNESRRTGARRRSAQARIELIA